MATLPVNKFTNRATAKIAADVSSIDTAITLVPGGGDWFPAPTGGDYFRLVLQKGTGQTDQREYMTCTARAGDTLTVVRGQEGTPAANFTAGDEVSLVVTAVSLDEFVQKAGVVMKGALEVEAPPTTPMGVANKQFVEDGRLPDAPIDGETYGRKDAAWSLLGDAASLPVPIPIDKGGTAGLTLLEAQTNLIIGLTTINDLPPATPKYGDRWIKPSNMTEMVWVPNAGGGGAGVWINPADAASEAYPLAVNKGGTGATDAATARTNLGITPANISALALDGSTTMVGSVKLANGSMVAPSLAFGSEVGLGWYRQGPATVALVAGGNGMWSVGGDVNNTFESIFPRADGGVSQLTLHDNKQGTAAQHQFYFRQQADQYIIGEALQSGATPSKPLNFVGFPKVQFTQQVLSPLFTVANSAFQMGLSGPNAVLQWAAGWYFQWDVANGNLTYHRGSGGPSTIFYQNGDFVAGRDIYTGSAGGMSMRNSVAGVAGLWYTSDGWKLEWQAGYLRYYNTSGTVITEMNGTQGHLAAYGSIFAGMSGGLGGYNCNVGSSGMPGLAVTGYYTTGQTLYQVLCQGNPNWDVTTLQSIHVQGDFAGFRMGAGAIIDFVLSTGQQWGRIRAAGFDPQSDERAKVNIEKMVHARDKFMAIQPISWHWPELPRGPDDPIVYDVHEREWGFSAQNFKAAGLAPLLHGDPSAVNEDGTPRLAAIDTVGIQALTVLALQDLIKRVEALEAT